MNRLLSYHADLFYTLVRSLTAENQFVMSAVRRASDVTPCNSVVNALATFYWRPMCGQRGNLPRAGPGAFV